jgi:hypothetical protein
MRFSFRFPPSLPRSPRCKSFWDEAVKCNNVDLFYEKQYEMVESVLGVAED